MVPCMICSIKSHALNYSQSHKDCTQAGGKIFRVLVWFKSSTAKYMFHAIKEFGQSQDWVAHSQNPETGCQTRDCTSKLEIVQCICAILKLCNQERDPKITQAQSCSKQPVIFSSCDGIPRLLASCSLGNIIQFGKVNNVIHFPFFHTSTYCSFHLCKLQEIELEHNPKVARLFYTISRLHTYAKWSWELSTMFHDWHAIPDSATQSQNCTNSETVQILKLCGAYYTFRKRAAHTVPLNTYWRACTIRIRVWSIQTYMYVYAVITTIYLVSCMCLLLSASVIQY